MPVCGSARSRRPWRARPAGDLSSQFVNPPQSAQPWVYWFWLNSNITREGITADLEAMKAAGIGGVLIMEVDQGAPVGPVAFASPKWLELFKHVCSEADRLGIEVNMNNDAGWNGSGGPWIKPELSMQKIVWTETAGRRAASNSEETLPAAAEAVANYYEDIAVMAFPTPAGNARIPESSATKPLTIAGLAALPAPASWPASAGRRDHRPQTASSTLTAKMDKDGKLTWDVPEGKWTILRIGHTSTGAENAPAPASGCGLECDKMSKEAAEAHFAGLMGKIIADVRPVGRANRWWPRTSTVGKTARRTGRPKFREEFQKRRGYDLMPLSARDDRPHRRQPRNLRAIPLGRAANDQRTGAAELRRPFPRNGPSPRNAVDASRPTPRALATSWPTAAAPTSRWASSGRGGSARTRNTASRSPAPRWPRPPTSTARRSSAPKPSPPATASNGWVIRPTSKTSAIGPSAKASTASSSTATPCSRGCTSSPACRWAPGDCITSARRPGGNMSKAWHEYLARCQYLLRQGLFVADVCYLGAEASPQSIIGQKRFLAKTPDPLDPNNPDYPRDRIDYSFDVCSTDALLTRMSVKDGRLVLPDGMSYRLLVLPNVETMTPKLLAKIKELVEAGATVVGSRPSKSPSLSDYPKCDEKVQATGRGALGIGRSARATDRAAGRQGARLLVGRVSEEIGSRCERPKSCWARPNGFGIPKAIRPSPPRRANAISARRSRSMAK